MNGDLPTLAMRLFRRETCVVMPPPVKELVGTIRQIAPREGWDRVDRKANVLCRPSLFGDVSRGCHHLIIGSVMASVQTRAGSSMTRREALDDGFPAILEPTADQGGRL